MESESIDSWLSRIQLSQYTKAFQQAGFHSVAQCHSLDEKKLLQMGIFLAGHIKRILAHLPANMNTNKSSTSSADHPYENLEGINESDSPGNNPPLLPPKGATNARKVQLSDLEKSQAIDRPQPKPRKSLSRGSLTSTGSKSNESLSKVSTGSHSNDSSPSSEVKSKPIPKPRSRTPKHMVMIEGVTAAESSCDSDDTFPSNTGKVLYATGGEISVKTHAIGKPEGKCSLSDLGLPLLSSNTPPVLEKVISRKTPSDDESTPEENTDDSGIYEQVWQMKTLPPKKPERTEQRQLSPEELMKFETPKDINKKFDFGNISTDRGSVSSFDMPPPMFAPPPLPLGPMDDAPPSLPPVPPRVLSPVQSDHRTSTTSTLSGSAVDPFQDSDPFSDFASECALFNEANLGAASSAASQFELSKGDMSRGFASAGQPPDTAFLGTQGGSAASSTQRPDSCIYMFDPLVTHRAQGSSGLSAVNHQATVPVSTSSEQDNDDSRNSMTFSSFDPFGLEDKSVYENTETSLETELPSALPSCKQTFDPFNLGTENDYSEFGKDDSGSDTRSQRQSDCDSENLYQNAEVIHQQGQTINDQHMDLSAIPPCPYPKTKQAYITSTEDAGIYSCAEESQAAHHDDTASSKIPPASPEKTQEKRIPILRNTSMKRAKERSGYLFKQGGVQNNKGWRKRWVIFSGEDLRYYTDNKTCVCKKILPVSCMTNVINDIKMEDSKKYRFKLVTANRVFIFAADSLEENSLWSNTLMEAILTHKPPPGGYKDGQKMHSPDKEGFIKLEGHKNKCFIAIKKDMLCYYNNYEDYMKACPINDIQMKLASVKEVNSTRLQLSTHYAQFMFAFESQADTQHWKIAIEDAIAEGLADDTILKKVMSNSSNQWCADCKASKPHWAAINMGIVLCKKCAGIHRELGLTVSRVKSLRMDTKIWTPSLIGLLIAVGNENGNNFWEFDMLSDMEICDETPAQQRKQHIEDKYKHKKYCRLHHKHANKSVLNQELLKSVETDDVIKTMQVLFSGAEVLSHRPGNEAETSFELAKRFGHTLQMELLYQNGGDRSARMTDSPTFQETRLRSTVSQQGFLYKTGSNRRDFLRRWCQLEHGSLNYFLDDKTTTAKDSISYDCMLSINTTSTDRYPHSFELSTTKLGTRLFLFAVDIVEDQTTWLQALAKCFCPISYMELIDNYNLSFCGYAHMKEGLTQDWVKSWMLICGRIMYYTTEMLQAEPFQEVDLRKILHIKVQENSQHPLILETGQSLVIDLPGRSLYVQMDLGRDTERLHSSLQMVSSSESQRLEDQQLTTSNIPVIVDKCISYIELNGITTEGIYRHSGTNSKVAKLLDMFRKDARAVIIRPEDFTVHEVTNCLKRYFRSLEDPVFTRSLYKQWIEKAAIEDQSTKIQWYQYLLDQLPAINKTTLKKIIHHLVTVSQHESENKMGIPQLASIFGPALMKLDSDATAPGQGGFGYTNREISLIMDMLQFHSQLFEMDKSELETKQKMERAMEKLKALTAFRPASSVDLGYIMPVYVDSPMGDCLTLQVTATMKVEELVEKAKEKKKLTGEWVLHECVCEGTVERPLNDQSRVLTITQEWQTWDEEYRKGVCLCLKVSDLVQTMHSLFAFHAPLFGELRFSEKKSYKKYCFEFKQSKLTCYKDARANNKIGEWEVEKLSIFSGVEKKRNPPAEFGFTFIVRGEKMKKSRDMPFFGRSVCCASRDEAINWMAGMYKAQYPNGFHS